MSLYFIRKLFPYFYHAGYHDCDSGGRICEWSDNWSLNGWTHVANLSREYAAGDGTTIRYANPLAWWRTKRERERWARDYEQAIREKEEERQLRRDKEIRHWHAEKSGSWECCGHKYDQTEQHTYHWADCPRCDA